MNILQCQIDDNPISYHYFDRTIIANPNPNNLPDIRETSSRNKNKIVQKCFENFEKLLSDHSHETEEFLCSLQDADVSNEMVIGKKLWKVLYDSVFTDDGFSIHCYVSSTENYFGDIIIGIAVYTENAKHQLEDDVY